MDLLKRKIAISFFYVMLLFTAACSSDQIVLGGITPLTGSIGDDGLTAQRGVDIAIAEINEAGGINGAPIKIIWEDGQCNSAASARAAEKLVNEDRVNAILGGVCSDETIAAAPIAENAQTILIAYGSRSTEISSLGDYIFRNYPNNAIQAETMANFVLAQLEKNSQNGKEPKVGLIVEERTQSQEIADSFLASFSEEELGNRVSAYETYSKSETNFSEIVRKVKESRASIVILLPRTSDIGTLILILEEMKRQQFAATVVSSEILRFGATAESSDLLEGVFMINRRSPSFGPRAEELSKRHNQTYGEESRSSLLRSSYDAVYMLRDAFLSCNGGKDADCVKNYLYSIRNYEGALSGISIDPNGDAIGYDYGVYSVVQGELVETPLSHLISIRNKLKDKQNVSRSDLLKSILIRNELEEELQQ